MSTDFGQDNSKVTQVIAPIQFTLTPEPVLLADFSYSTLKSIKRGNPTTRNKVILDVCKIMVKVLKRFDAAAIAAQAAGQDEKVGPAVLTYIIRGDGANEVGDVNDENFDTMFAPFEPDGDTCVMPNLEAWEEDRNEEFKSDKAKDIQRTFCLTFVMDGALTDLRQFYQWASIQPDNVLMFIALVGDGDDTRQADQVYEGLARDHKNIKAVSFLGETDPMVIARTMLQFYGLHQEVRSQASL